MREQTLGRMIRYRQSVIVRLERDMAGLAGQRDVISARMGELTALRAREEMFCSDDNDGRAEDLARWLDQWCFQVDDLKKKRDHIEDEVTVLRERLLEQMIEKEKISHLVEKYQDKKKVEEARQEQRICDDLAFLIRK